MGKTIRVSEEFHERIEAHKRDDETMEEALIRMVGGPHPEDAFGILDDEAAEEIEAAIDDVNERSKASLRRTAEKLTPDDDNNE